jgi:hypothetical protein
LRGLVFISLRLTVFIERAAFTQDYKCVKVLIYKNQAKYLIEIKKRDSIYGRTKDRNQKKRQKWEAKKTFTDMRRESY